VEFLAPEVRAASRKEDKVHRRAMQQLVAHESDEVSMSRYTGADLGPRPPGPWPGAQ
jgi:hypothetical protein